MNPEALILRRCYPVPVSFADLRYAGRNFFPWPSTTRAEHIEGNVYRPMAAEGRRIFQAELKAHVGALDEVYAVVDGREVRVSIALDGDTSIGTVSRTMGLKISDLLDKADRAGYWERPHEVRLDLSPRPVSHGEVARAVLVGQEALERGGVVRPR